LTRVYVDTPEGVRLSIEIAGAGSRFAAALLDFSILGALYLITLLLVALLSSSLGGVSHFVLGFMLLGAPLWIVAYHVGLHLLWSGRTIGKYALGLRVSGADGQPARALALLMRGLLQLIDILPIPAPIGWISIAVTARHQRLGDLAAGTLVVRASRELPPSEPFVGESWATISVRQLPLVAAHAARLTNADYTLLRDVVLRESMAEDERRQLYADVAAYYSNLLGLGPIVDPRGAIKELYLFTREGSRGD
jgi:uncharacterized RDD family membrane protein YckC